MELIHRWNGHMFWIGALLMIVSGVGFLSLHSTPSQAEAASCVPASTGMNSQTTSTNWRMQNWIRWANTPVGPSKWTVSTRLKNNGLEDCAVEDWSLQKVALQSTQDQLRGMVITPSDPVNNQDLYPVASLEFFYPVVTNQKSVKIKKTTLVCKYINISSCFTTKTFSYDTAYDSPDGLWNTVGMYGILRNSRDDLHETHGYLPLEWLVTGR